MSDTGWHNIMNNVCNVLTHQNTKWHFFIYKLFHTCTLEISCTTCPCRSSKWSCEDITSENCCYFNYRFYLCI